MHKHVIVELYVYIAENMLKFSFMRYTMVLILDGKSEIGAHVYSEI